MGCFPSSGKSFSNRRNERRSGNNGRHRRDHQAQDPPVGAIPPRVGTQESAVVNQSGIASTSRAVVNQSDIASTSRAADASNSETNVLKARSFAFRDLVAATQNFKADNFLGEGGFGKVFKGRLLDTDEVVAIKQLDPNGCQGVREFVVEVLTLGLADHPNLVKLIGYCAEGDQRLLVYEYMPLGSLDEHLHDPYLVGGILDWNSRMKIAAGAARGLEYLHVHMKPPLIYRDLKCSNILLGEGYHAKLSDFGLAKVGPSGDQTHVSTRVMGTYGYCAPDYAMTGQLNFKSDIYSFGVVLLEIITGRRAIDSQRSRVEQNLVSWAKPLFRDRRKFNQLVDPALEGRYPVRGLYQAIAIAAMCVQEQPNLRPLGSEIVSALNFLASQIYDPTIHPIQSSDTNPSSSQGHRRSTN